MLEPHLIKRTQEQWINKIKSLTKKDARLFHKVCAMVWWDYCDILAPCKELQDLAHEIDLSHFEFDEEALLKVLIGLGYSEPVARERARRKIYDCDEDINIL